MGGTCKEVVHRAGALTRLIGEWIAVQKFQADRVETTHGNDIPREGGTTVNGASTCNRCGCAGGAPNGLEGRGARIVNND